MIVKGFQIAELVSLFICILCIRKMKNTSVISFFPFLLLINIYEIGTMKGWFTVNNSNHFAANIFMMIHFLFYLSFISNILSSKKTKAILIGTIILLCSFFIINFTFYQGKYVFNSYTYLFGSLIIISWCCQLFILYMKNIDKVQVFKSCFFWIYLGLFFYYSIRFFFMSYFTLITTSYNETISSLFKSLTTISIFVLYSCISIGLICFKPPVKKV